MFTLIRMLYDVMLSIKRACVSVRSSNADGGGLVEDFRMEIKLTELVII